MVFTTYAMLDLSFMPLKLLYCYARFIMYALEVALSGIQRVHRERERERERENNSNIMSCTYARFIAF